MLTPDYYIDISHLTKDFGQGRGIFDVTFQVLKGECFGFLGPNGAGKSTTIRHLLGFTRPDTGSAKIRGKEALKEHSEVMKNIGYLPGEIALPAFLTGKEVIEEQMALKGVENARIAEKLCEYFQLDASIVCKKMSLGQKRKLAIVCAFLSDPEILILDEPSSGLDPNMQKKFLDLINLEKKHGRTILFSSHIFSEIDAACDRIAVIKDGHIVSILPSSSLKHSPDKTYTIEFKDKGSYENFLEHKPAPWGVISKTEEDHTIAIKANDKDISELLAVLKEVDVQDVSIKRQSLEDYFMSFYREDKAYGGI